MTLCLATKGKLPRYLLLSLISKCSRYELFGNTFSDNDSLAAIVAGGIDAQLLIILTDVDGVYDRPPSHPQAKVIHTYTKQVSAIRHSM
jgi:glutamate 5-kinase